MKMIQWQNKRLIKDGVDMDWYRQRHIETFIRPEYQPALVYINYQTGVVMEFFSVTDKDFREIIVNTLKGNVCNR